ncbi:hypothetical protein AB0L70_35705 [Kribbella sp. NPDC051952]|uniref:hypothetical protein n=1 Tax=Kribbella sp. NPDC051952 TaxID=3154851 RepID=UPI00341648B8
MSSELAACRQRALSMRGKLMNELPTPSARPDDSGRADKREHDADSRDAALDTRERAADARESAQAGSDQANQAILAAADERDKAADVRDALADERDRAASLDSFLRDADYGPGHKARMSAGMDRVDSKDDRISAADDRSNLTRNSRERSELDDD